MSQITSTVRLTLFNLQCPDNFSEEFPDPEDFLYDEDFPGSPDRVGPILMTD